MTEEKKSKKYPEAIVGGLIINQKGEILLGRALRWNGKYTCFGGHIELGERAKDTAIREAKEETGLDVKIIAQLDFSESIFDKDNKEEHFVFLDYVCEYAGDKEPKLNEEFEVDSAIWVSIDEAKKLDLAKGTEDLIEAYSKWIKREDYLLGWKRCMADFENYKKRQQESAKNIGGYIREDMLLQIIPVIDNFHSATEHIPEEQKNVPWVVGIMYIQKQLEDILKENGVTEIDVKVGDEFDPNLHEAVASNPAYAEASAGKQGTVNSEQESKDSDQGTVNSDQEAGKKELENKIKKVVLKGYRLGEKVIRAARVIVE